jgi:signal transduction histidine kinase
LIPGPGRFVSVFSELHRSRFLPHSSELLTVPWRRWTSTTDRIPAVTEAALSAGKWRALLIGMVALLCLLAPVVARQASAHLAGNIAVAAETGWSFIGQIRLDDASSWERYGWQVIGVLALCLLETLLIAALLIQRWKRGRAEQLLAERLNFETVLADTSRTFTDVTSEQVSSELQRWLSRIGAATRAQQVAVLVLDERARRLDVLHHWKSGTTEPPELFPLAGNELDLIRRGVVVTRPIGLQDATAPALVLVPLAVGGETWGALALQTQTATPFGAGVPTARLRLLGEVIANALARSRAAKELAARTTALRESHEEYRRLADRLIEAQENERRRIARELHDDITQRLTLIGLEAGEIERRNNSGPSIAPRSALEKLASELSRLIGDVTRLSHRLHPSLLERVGLVTAVRVLCHDLSGRHGVEVCCRELHVPRELPEAQALAVYRVAQEALRNVLKHSRAQRADVMLAVESDSLILEIADDGQGFEIEESWETLGLGLQSMRERVQMLSGTMSVRSTPGSGTAVRVELPLNGRKVPEEWVLSASGSAA